MSRSILPCSCGYLFEESGPIFRDGDDDEYDGPLFNCPEKGLANHITYPPFRRLSDEYQPSGLYYRGWDSGILQPAIHWCFVGEIIADVLPPVMSSVTTLRTRFGEEMIVAWYTDNGVLPANMKKGNTLCILYAERKQFLDGRNGIRQESIGHAYVFPCTYEQLRAETHHLWRNAHEKAKHCFQCNKATGSRCGKCKLAYYCSTECQSAAWGLHKKLCGDEAKILGLALMPEMPFGDQLSWVTLVTEAKEFAKTLAESSDVSAN